MADFKQELLDTLETYSEDVTDRINEEAERCAKGLRKDLRSGSPSRTGSYAKSWQAKITGTAAGGAKEYTVHNRGHYQLTHLLEHGHSGPHGHGFVAPRTHIGPLEKKWTEDFEESVEKVLSSEG